MTSRASDPFPPPLAKHWYLHKIPEARNFFQGKALSSNLAQMNWMHNNNIFILYDGYDAVFSGFFFG